jgi:hypothetical protein
LIVVCEQDDVWDRIRAGITPPGQTDRAHALVLRYRPEGGSADTLATVLANEYAVIERDGRPSTMYPPLGRRLAYAVTDKGLYVGSQESFQILQYSPTGRLLSILRGPALDLTITAADLDAMREDLLANSRADPAAARRSVDEYLSTTPRPENRSAYGRLVVDSSGVLWVSEGYHPYRVPTLWGAIDLDRGHVARITIPERFEPYEIGNDYILGRWRDETGVEYVRQYSLRRS